MGSAITEALRCALSAKGASWFVTSAIVLASPSCGGSTAASGRDALSTSGGADSGASPRPDAAGSTDGLACLETPSPCSSNTECCTNACWSGHCQIAGCLLPTQRGCVGSQDCCFGENAVGCGSGYCIRGATRGSSLPPPLNGMCKVTAEMCNTDAECCEANCFSGICFPSDCGRPGDHCTNNAECCDTDSYFCDNGACQKGPIHL